MGGGSSVFNTGVSHFQGRDATSGLTAVEEQVLKSELESRIEEAKKNGGKVNLKAQNEMYDQIIKDMDAGRISIDSIERALGGESYLEYLKEVQHEEKLIEEYNKLLDTPESKITRRQTNRLATLEKQIANIKGRKQSGALKTKMGETVFGMVKDSRLIESYNERGRRGKAFTADLSKYDEAQRATVQKAVDAGFLNDTNRTHEFVDTVAKISAEKGISFDFTNNKKLRESGFAVAGKTVNAYVTKDGITVNMDSPKAWQTTVGHEIAHVLEGTEHYAALSNAIVEYAKKKGDYGTRYKTVSELYKDMDGAEIEKELTAELVGEYLFTDENFVKNLSANKSLFEKVYDEIKYLAKQVLPGSKEAKQLEKVKRLFEKAYAEDVKGKTGDGVTYSLEEQNTEEISLYSIETLRDIGRKSVNLFSDEDIKKAEPWARKFYRELGTKSPFFRRWFGDWRAYDTETLQTTVAKKDAQLKNGRSTNKDTGKIISWNAHDIVNETKNHAVREKVSVEAINQLDEIIKNSVLLDTVVSEHTSKSKMPNTAFMHSFYTVYENDSGKHLLKLYVEEALSNNEKTVFTRAYQLKDIKKVADLPDGVSEGIPSLSDDRSATINSIADLFALVKQYDKEFSPKAVDPVFLNEDGTPKVFYHGTDQRFTIFDPQEMSSREGSFFFAENREDAQAYGKHIYEVYLTGSKIADYDHQPAEFYKQRNKRAQVAWLKERGYDGWYADIDSDGWGEVSVFENTQVKSATKNIGTFSNEKDIRFSLSSKAESPSITSGFTAPLRDLSLQRENAPSLASTIEKELNAAGSYDGWSVSIRKDSKGDGATVTVKKGRDQFSKRVPISRTGRNGRAVNIV